MIQNEKSDCIHWSHLEHLSQEHKQKGMFKHSATKLFEIHIYWVVWRIACLVLLYSMELDLMLVKKHVQNRFLVLEDTALNLVLNCQQALWAFLCHENSNIFFIISTRPRECVCNTAVLLNWLGAGSLLTQHMVSHFQITKTTFLWGRASQKARGIEIQRGLIFTRNYTKSRGKCKIRLNSPRFIE